MMRDYSKVGPRFWHSETCRELKARGSEGAVVALYLLTAPASTMLGVYSLGIGTIADDTGLPYEGALKGLRDCVEVGFASFDAGASWVWVHEMAAWQIAPSLKSGDNRVKGIQRDYEALPDTPLTRAWFERYGEAFCLKARAPQVVSKPRSGVWFGEGPSQAPSGPPSKPGTGTGTERTGTGARAVRVRDPFGPKEGLQGEGAGDWPGHDLDDSGPDPDPDPDQDAPQPPREAPPRIIDTAQPQPSLAGIVCRAMRDAKLASVNPGDPRLLALLAQGATIEEFAGMAAEAVEKGKGFAWALVALEKRREQAAGIRLQARQEPAKAWDGAQ